MEFYCDTFQALGSKSTVQLYCADSTKAHRVFRAIHEEVFRIERKFSRYRTDSIVSEINESAGSGRVIRVDEETAALLDYAALCYEESRGFFDITAGALRRAWNFKEPRVPSDGEIRPLLECIGWNKVEWHNPYICLPLPGMEIDLGGIGKEYAVDVTAELVQNFEVCHGLINFGGDVRVIGPHPDGSGWQIGLQHPRCSNGVIGTIEIFRGALATSGDYERYFERDGRRFCHILNPHTGWPVDTMQSISVRAEQCLIAGSAATIAMLLGTHDGGQFLSNLGLEHVCVDREGEVLKFNEQDCRRLAL